VTRKVTRYVGRLVAAQASRRAAEVSKLRLGNLDAERDWGWAPEYVGAMRAMVRGGAEPGDYVVATGKTHSVREFAEKAFRVAGFDLGDLHTAHNGRVAEWVQQPAGGVCNALVVPCAEQQCGKHDRAKQRSRTGPPQVRFPHGSFQLKGMALAEGVGYDAAHQRFPAHHLVLTELNTVDQRVPEFGEFTLDTNGYLFVAGFADKRPGHERRASNNARRANTPQQQVERRRNRWNRRVKCQLAQHGQYRRAQCNAHKEQRALRNTNGFEMTRDAAEQTEQNIVMTVRSVQTSNSQIRAPNDR